jgi:hypothetical protein
MRSQAENSIPGCLRARIENDGMKYLLASALLFVLTPRTASEDEREACEAPIDLEIDCINARMRGGHSR